MRADSAEKFTNATALALTICAIYALSVTKFDMVPKLNLPLPEPTQVELALEASPEPPAPAPPPPPPDEIPPLPPTEDSPLVEPPKPPVQKPKPQPPKPQPVKPQPAAQPAPETPVAAAPTTAPVSPAPPAAAPAPPAPTPPSPDSIFSGQLRAYLKSITRYPTSKEARLQKPQGNTEVRFVLSRAGEMSEVIVSKSSGSLLLDQEALSIVRRGTYPHFPDDVFANQATHVFFATIEFFPG